MPSLNIYSQLDIIASDHPHFYDIFVNDKSIDDNFFFPFKDWEFLWILKSSGVLLFSLPNVPLYQEVSLQQKSFQLKAMLDNQSKFEYWYHVYANKVLSENAVCVHICVQDNQGSGIAEIVTLPQSRELMDAYAYVYEEVWKIGYMDFTQNMCNLELFKDFPEILRTGWSEGYSFGRDNTHIKDAARAWLVYCAIRDC